jgi:hypothetical protein
MDSGSQNRQDYTIDTPRQAVADGGTAYVSAYLRLRLLIGTLAVLLPVMLLAGDAILLPEPITARGSLSAYYHSGMRDEFVGVLVAIGTFLLTYKVAEWDKDNFLSCVAGLALIVVAVFPTWRPDGNPTLPTPLQELMGENLVADIHAVAAGVCFVSLAGMSYLFGVREGQALPPRGRRSPSFWRAFHWICSGLVAFAVVGVAVADAGKVGGSATLWFETTALVAFGTSWFAKGFQLKRLVWTPTVRSTGVDQNGQGA